MVTLFQQYRFQKYQFPPPQYLGAKYVHRRWIAHFIPPDAERVLDAFGGTQSIAFTMKQLGKSVLCNDFLSFSHQIGKALIENKRSRLDEDDLSILFTQSHTGCGEHLMEDLFANIFFSVDEARFLDSFRLNVRTLDDPYKQALALTVMCRSLTRKVTMGHFAHTQALKYALSPARVRRNRSLVLPIKQIFLNLLSSYNDAVFDNGRYCQSFNENILDLLPHLDNIDFVYFDPPYCGSHADYQSFYHLLETFVVYWKDKHFVNSINRYEPKRYSGFDKKSEAKKNFQKLFGLSSHIPTWLISYNDRSYPTIDQMQEMIAPYRRVEIFRKEYTASRGGKGSVAGSNELLLLCTPY